MTYFTNSLMKTSFSIHVLYTYIKHYCVKLVLVAITSATLVYRVTILHTFRVRFDTGSRNYQNRTKFMYGIQYEDMYKLQSNIVFTLEQLIRLAYQLHYQF